jgi:uncharacterized protein (DUF302 family)
MVCDFKKALFRIPFEALTEQLTCELYKEGFIILHTSDLRKVFKENLHVDLRKYKIVSVLNPHLSNEMLKLEFFTGLMLPCIITIQEYNSNDEIEMTVTNPSKWIVQTIDNPSLQNITEEISRRLNLVIELLSRKPAGSPE